MVLVALHPVTQDPTCWQWLSQSIDIAPELPGPLLGKGIPKSFSLEDLADDVARAISEPADVIGVAMGSLVAQYLVLRHPEKVRSLVLACAPARMMDGQAYAERAVNGLLHGMDSVVDETLNRWFTSEAISQKTPGVEYARQRLRTFSPAVFARAWVAVAGHRPGNELGAIDCPTTVVSGRYDVSAPPNELWDMHRHILGSRFLSLDGPHMMHLERPDLLSGAIDGHLQWAASILR